MSDLEAPPVVDDAEAGDALALGRRQQRILQLRIAVQRHGPDVQVARAQGDARRLGRREGRIELDFIHADSEA